tara:strand:- start:87 stop:830 length:744 start_codon:yes stop_codon:yes gene_type:complete
MSTYEANRYAFPASAITSGTFANARLSSGSVTQHVDLTSLSADNLTSGTVPSARLSLGASDIPSLATSKITSGTFADARISSSSVTQHASSVTNTSGTWSPGVSHGSISLINAHYQRVGDIVHATAHWASTGTSGTDQSTLFYFTGLPVTSRNLGNAHRNAGLGDLICRGGGLGRLIVKSNSTNVYYINGGDVRNLNDLSGQATYATNPGGTAHYAVRNNFKDSTKDIYSWSTTTNKHFMFSLTYLV